MNKTRVIQSTGSWYKAVTPEGETVKCRLPGRMRLNEKRQTNPVAVGDEVAIEIKEDGTAIITEIHERRNQIPRQATHGRRGEHIIAANIDLAFSVQSVKQPKYKTGFIDRFLVTCEAYGVEPAILINKTDLAVKKDTEKLEATAKLYAGLGYRFLSTSIHDPESLEQLRETTTNRTCLFVGPSGAGKSSLLNALDPQLELPVGQVSASSGKGRHTTTFAELIPLSHGAWLVDTPGIREFGLVGFKPAELSLYFPEMRNLREQCRYYNCTHIHEPGCAVLQALEAGDIHPDRYASYRRIIDSL